jgi:linoleoyl-CoA desaturase
VQQIARKNYVKFAPKGEDSFYDTLKYRVEQYFKTHDIAEHGNAAMYIKTASMLALYFVPYLFIVTGLASFNTWLFMGLWLVMGLGIVGIGTGVMHDSNHGSYSTNKTLNTLMGNVLNLLGGYALNWRIQHNILHHTYTNLHGLDEDIDAGLMIRMSPQKPYYKFHRYQHIYAWLLYPIMNLFWITVKDFRQLGRYDKQGLLRNQKVTLRKAATELAIYKVVYVVYMIVLPIAFSGMPWYTVVAGFVAMHLVAGFSLAAIFQPAHVMETSDFAVPNEQRKMENAWAVHQVLNTTDFCPKSRITSWFMGGLNYQIEHHLFPQICHIHYPKIAPIVRETILEYGLPYNVVPTFVGALIEHGRMLKILGQKPVPVMANNTSVPPVAELAEAEY